MMKTPLALLSLLIAGIVFGEALELRRGDFTLTVTDCPQCPMRARFAPDGKQAFLNRSKVSERDRDAMTERIFALMEKTADMTNGGVARFLTDWSSWNMFVDGVPEEAIFLDLGFGFIKSGRGIDSFRNACARPDSGRVPEEVQFGMWCTLSSSLLTGWAARDVSLTTLEFVTNPYLLVMCQDGSGLAESALRREGDMYVFAKDADERHGTARFLALYNDGPGPCDFSVTFASLDLGGKVQAMDLGERAELGVFEGVFSVTLPAYGARFYRLDAERRLGPVIGKTVCTDQTGCRVQSGSEVPFGIGVAGYTFVGQTIDRALEVLRELDVHALCVKDFHLKLDCTQEEADSFNAQLAAAGVVPVGVGPIYADTEEKARKGFEQAKKLGVRLVVGVPFERETVEGRPVRVESDRMLDVIDRLVKEYDMRYAIHNHGPDIPRLFPTAEAVIKRIGGRDRRIGVCLDIGHERRAGLDPAKFILTHPDRIYDVHLKNITIDRSRNLAERGPRGQLDIPAVFAALSRVGYSGFCNIEYERDFDNNLLGLLESVGYYRGVRDAIRVSPASVIRKELP